MAIGDSHILYNSVPLYPNDISDPQHLVWNNGMAECWFFDGMLILMECWFWWNADFDGMLTDELPTIQILFVGTIPWNGSLLEWRQFLDCRNVNKGEVREWRNDGTEWRNDWTEPMEPSNGCFGMDMEGLEIWLKDVWTNRFWKQFLGMITVFWSDNRVLEW